MRVNGQTRRHRTLQPSQPSPFPPLKLNINPAILDILSINPTAIPSFRSGKRRPFPHTIPPKNQPPLERTSTSATALTRFPKTGYFMASYFERFGSNP